MAAGEDHSYHQEGIRRKKGKKAMSKGDGYRKENLAKKYGNQRDETVKTERHSSVQQASFVRFLFGFTT